MNILICTTTFSSITHGPSKFVNNLLNDPFLSDHTQIRVITKDVEHPIKNKIYKYSNQLPRVLGSLWEFQENYSFYKEIKKVLLEFEPDYIIFNNALTALYSIKRLKYSSIYVGFIQDYEKLLKGTQYPLFSKLRIHSLKSRFLEKRAANNLDAIVTCSRYLKNYIYEEYKVSADKVFMLYQGVHIQKFNFKDRSELDFLQLKSIEILFIKSNSLIGGLRVLYNSLNLLSNYKFKLVICGDLPQESISQLSLSFSNVEIDFRGPTSQENILSLMNECHILSIPSLREGLGVANIEGLATGIPVVSTNVGGIPEVLGNGKYGWLANPNDPEDLANAIDVCIKSPLERSKRSLLGRKYVEEVFSKKDMAKNFYHLLKSINP